MTEGMEQQGGQYSIESLLESIFRYVARFWILHLVFACVALAGGYFLAQCLRNYSAEACFVQPYEWVSPSELQYMLNKYASPAGDEAHAPAGGVVSVRVKQEKKGDAKNLFFSVTASRPIDTDSIARDLVTFFKGNAYLQSMATLRMRSLELQIRSYDSMTSFREQQLKELNQEDRILMVLALSNRAAENKNLEQRESSLPSLKVERMYLRENMFNVLFVSNFSKKILPWVPLYSGFLLIALSALWGIVVRIRFLHRG